MPRLPGIQKPIQTANKLKCPCHHVIITINNNANTTAWHGLDAYSVIMQQHKCCSAELSIDAADGRRAIVRSESGIEGRKDDSHQAHSSSFRQMRSCLSHASRLAAQPFGLSLDFHLHYTFFLPLSKCIFICRSLFKRPVPGPCSQQFPCPAPQDPSLGWPQCAPASPSS